MNPLLLLLPAILTATVLAQTPTRAPVSLLLPDTPARPAAAGAWLALQPSRDGFSWQRVNVRIADGKAVLPAGSDTPLLLLRGLPHLLRKPVHTCFDRSETGSLHEQNPILLTCEARAFRVEITDPRRTIAAGRPSRLVFSHAGREQVLWQWPEGLADERAELVFAGDLDGDDALDLLLDHAAPNESTRLTLYLSTWARPGQWVGRVATFVLPLR